MTVKRTLATLAAAGAAATALGAGAATPAAQAVCKPDPILGVVCLSDCPPPPAVDPKDLQGTIEEALRPKVCPD